MDPTPIGLAPLPAINPVADGASFKLMLQFDATQAEPPLENLFLTKGGTLAGAATRGETEFALSGADAAHVVKLNESFSTTVSVAMPEHMFKPSADSAMVVEIDNRAKMMVTSLRDGAAINGTIVQSMAGQGAIYLANLLRAATGNATIPLTYANWSAHTAVVAASNVRLVDADGRQFKVHFVENPERDAVLTHAEALVGKWAEGAWALRTNEGGLPYKYSPTLTKSIAKQPVGINDTGFDLVHNVLEMITPYSWDTVDSLLSSAIQVDLEFVPEDIATFLGETKAPGLKAASHGRVLGSALSMIAAHTISYRADGRTRVAPVGSESVAAESWLKRPPTPIEGNDCDGGAILTQSIVNTIVRAPPEVCSKYEYIKAARNVVYPYYTVGVTVLGAAGASAETAEAASREQSLAGHAATLMVPTLSLLEAIDKGSEANVSGVPVIEPAEREAAAAARLASCFGADVLATLPDEERLSLTSWASAKLHATDLVSFGVEGTTPASPILYATGQTALDSEVNSARDTAAFAKASPNVGRSIKILHVGGAEASNPHKFYHDFVEFDVARGHPLWSGTEVRAAGVASTQFVLSKPADHVTGAISAAGASPRDLVTREFTAVPLVVANEETAGVLDFASAEAELHVMPPRAPGFVLSQFQSEQLSKSLASLASLDEAFKGSEKADGHTVAYVLAYNSMVNNPLAVEHFCSKLKEVAVSGTVDALDIVGMASTHDGAEAGKFVVINACIPI
jgi:hypothetical protein